MKKLLSFGIYVYILLFAPTNTFAQTNIWLPVSDIWPNQYANSAPKIHFLENGPMGRDWIYGGFFDSDSTRRYAAYREGGKWVSVPFSGYNGSYTNDIIMYGDTIYIGGNFRDPVLDSDSSTLPNTGVIKWWNDSLWVDTLLTGPKELAVKGDSLLIWGSSYFNPPDIIYNLFMTTDGGQSWQYPFNIVHPTESISYFGAESRLKILPDGDILMVNDGSPIGTPFDGIVRWDGQQWHSYGSGLYGGGYVAVVDFDFYKGDLHIGGTFAKYNTFMGDTFSIYPQNPGNGIARWDGQQWHNVGGGIIEVGVRDIFIHDDVMYCHTLGGNRDYHKFGDVDIPHLAGWDGHQWCGTPTIFQSGVSPQSFGFINDTLYMAFNYPTSLNGSPKRYMFYFDGDYLHGPGSICSTLGLGEEERTIEKAEISIYPNPTNVILNITLPREVEDARLSLFSLSGQLVFVQQLAHEQNQLKKLPASLKGLYLAVVERYIRRKCWWSKAFSFLISESCQVFKARQGFIFSAKPLLLLQSSPQPRLFYPHTVRPFLAGILVGLHFQEGV